MDGRNKRKILTMKRGVYTICSLALMLLCLSSCKKDDLSDLELNSSICDQDYDGPSPFSIVDTDYFRELVFNNVTNQLDTLHKADIIVGFNRSLLNRPGQEYSALLDGIEPDSVLNMSQSQFTFTRDVDPDIEDYCSDIEFLDADFISVNTFNHCYTIDFTE